jgi:superfamily II DNA/RNA helicase
VYFVVVCNLFVHVSMSARRDTIVQAQSGTGKTGTFSIAALQIVNSSVRSPQVLLMSPTRELAQQTFLVLTSIGLYLPSIRSHLFIGGKQTSDDLKALREGVHIAIGTPGRVVALIDRRQMNVEAMKLVVLDEADELLKQGFQDSMRFIFRTIPSTTQLCLCSATIPQEIIDLSSKFLRDPVQILVPPEKVTLEGINQYYVHVEQREKYDVLCDLFNGLSLQQTIVYCNSRRTVEWLTTEMRKDDHVVSSIHADLEPAQRSAIMHDFRATKSRVLISTDLTARGIDVQGVSLVVNFEIPRDRECYIHRIGRSGRHGRKGTAINFISPAEVADMQEIEKFWKTSVQELPELDKIQL